MIEGLDGAGKRTLADRLLGALAGHGARTATLAFPRYADDVHAELVRDALHGRLGDLADSVHGMAVLFALDRRAAAPGCARHWRSTTSSSSTATSPPTPRTAPRACTRTPCGEFVAWVRELEVERFGVPVPDRHLLLAVPQAVAAERAAHRERTEPGRERDRYESDAGLQERTAAVYRGLAATGWLAPWTVLDGRRRSTPTLAGQLLG